MRRQHLRNIILILIFVVPRAYHGCITVNGIIYVVGGFDGIEYFNTCKSFEPKLQKWIEIAPMHTKRCYVSVTEHDKYIYALGGCDGTIRHSSVEKYNIDRNQWTFIAPMNFQRSDASATTLDGLYHFYFNYFIFTCLFQDMIYICGGFNGHDCLNTAEYYNPNTNQWTLLTQMRQRRSGVGVVAFNKCVYAIGGFDGITRMMTGEKYNPKTQQWTTINSMYTPRSNFAIEVLFLSRKIVSLEIVFIIFKGARWLSICNWRL